MLTLPHPVWMWVGAILLVPAAGWLGGRLAVKVAQVGKGS
jgi:hypothetical protein